MAQATDAQTNACTLGSHALAERVEAWRQLTAQTLHREEQPGRVISTYANDPEVVARLKGLVDMERQCCSFLGFDIREEADVVTVELRYPPEFAPFLAAVLT